MKTKTKRGKPAFIETTRPTPSSSKSVEDLVAEAAGYVDTCEYPLAMQAYKAALEQQPDNVGLLEAAGVVLMELGMLEKAKKNFEKAVMLQPEHGYSKYMYLGQLSISAHAITHYRRGVELMSKDFENMNAGTIPVSDEVKALSRKISSALVAMTEIYLTDLCMEPDAETNCETFLSQAATVDPSNPEIYQTFASVRLSQQRDEDAKQAVLQSISLWKGLESGDPSMPSYETRINLVKLLLELALHSESLSVLGNLEAEDEKPVELWYLYGYAYYLMAEDHETGNLRLGDETVVQDSEGSSISRSIAVQNARECLLTAQKYYISSEIDDVGIRDHIKELLASIRRLLPDDSMEEEEADEGEEGTGEWEDILSEEDEDAMMEL